MATFLPVTRSRGLFTSDEEPGPLLTSDEEPGPLLTSDEEPGPFLADSGSGHLAILLQISA